MLINELKPWIYTDPLIYQALTAQEVGDLSDRETLLHLVKAMAERHEHTQRQLIAFWENSPPSPITLNIGI